MATFKGHTHCLHVAGFDVDEILDKARYRPKHFKEMLKGLHDCLSLAPPGLPSLASSFHIP